MSEATVKKIFTNILCYVDRESAANIDTFEAANDCHFTTASAFFKWRCGFHRKKIKAEEKQVAVYVHNVHSIIDTKVTASRELQSPLHTAPQEVVKIAKCVKHRPLYCYL
jgi:hypothetical protein